MRLQTSACIWTALLLPISTQLHENLRNGHNDIEIVSHHLTCPSARRSKQANAMNNLSAEACRLVFKAFGILFQVDLTLNVGLLSQNFFVTIRGSDASSVYRPSVDHCHYKGKLKDKHGSLAAISICANGVSGFIQVGNGETFHLLPDRETLQSVIVMRDSANISLAEHIRSGLHPELNASAFRFHLSTLRTTGRHHVNRTRRHTMEPPSSNENSLFLELVLVADATLYQKYHRNPHAITQRLAEIASVVNTIYSSLNIFVVLTGLEIWDGADRINMATDSETILRNFMRYRTKDLSLRMPNDHAHLISFRSLGGNIVGKAPKGTICTSDSSVGISKDHSPSAGPVGATVAHEIGHNFGMDHDSTHCHCPDRFCVMTPVGGRTPINWSSCSKDALRSHMERDIGGCLKNIPNPTEMRPYCGNGFLEDGEECDCGPTEFCRNKCCIASTCRLSVNSTCGHGNCCDLESCTPRAAASECRSAAGECDLPEFCDGTSGLCPRNFWVANGTPCKGGEAYCFDGACTGHEDRCKYLWGSSGSMADDLCYHQLNVMGNANGHCGYDRIRDSYSKCEVNNAKCGLLQCSSRTNLLAVGADGAAIMTGYDIRNWTFHTSCKSGRIDFGLAVQDPGMVPDGAKCGHDMMCLNQICTPISLLTRPCPANCNGIGICNNNGHCHCPGGFGPPDCSSGGYGGSSTDSHPASSSTVESYWQIRDTLLIIFLLAIPVIALLLFAFRGRIKGWMRGKRRRSLGDAVSCDSLSSSRANLLTLNQPKSAVLISWPDSASLSESDRKRFMCETDSIAVVSQLAKAQQENMNSNGVIRPRPRHRPPPPPQAIPKSTEVFTVTRSAPVPILSINFNDETLAGRQGRHFPATKHDNEGNTQWPKNSVSDLARRFEQHCPSS